MCLCVLVYTSRFALPFYLSVSSLAVASPRNAAKATRSNSLLPFAFRQQRTPLPTHRLLPHHPRDQPTPTPPPLHPLSAIHPPISHPQGAHATPLMPNTPTHHPAGYRIARLDALRKFSAFFFSKGQRTRGASVVFSTIFFFRMYLFYFSFESINATRTHST